VLWAITKGSFLNKLILLPLAFLLSAFAPGVIVPILMLGGLYLAYEGAEKIVEWLFHPAEAHEAEAEEEGDPVSAERQKIRSAILTDFILSIEIVIIALGTVSDQPLAVQIPVVTLVAFAATIGVYGLVALIVRLDDMGAWLVRRSKGRGLLAALGRLMVAALPKIVKSLSIIGTLAMLLVAGGIFLHHLPWLHELFHAWPPLAAELAIGLALGLAAVVVLWPVQMLLGLIGKN
jgi:predicted DNA repair protein MutK